MNFYQLLVLVKLEQTRFGDAQVCSGTHVIGWIQTMLWWNHLAQNQLQVLSSMWYSTDMIPKSMSEWNEDLKCKYQNIIDWYHSFWLATSFTPITTNAEVLRTIEKVTFPKMGKAWFDPDVITNILCYAEMAKCY